MKNSTPSELNNCVSDIQSRHIFTAWFSVYLLLLPLFLLVLYVGFNKWKNPQSSASGGLSHSDVFTLHMVVMEMISLTGSCVTCCGFYMMNADIAAVGGDTVVTTTIAQMLFHALTCVERYLAVVHPVTYLRLRGEGGVTVRNVSIASVWVFCVVYYSLCRFIKLDLFYIVAGLSLCIGPLPLVVYCSVYVLYVLTRPKPGERGGPRKLIDQSKRSTVYTMVAILGVLLLRLVTDMASISTYLLSWLSVRRCVIMTSSLWSVLPSSLVLPLLFLQRAGKLTLCK